MSSLATEIHAIPPELFDGKVRCKFSTFTAALDAEDSGAVEELLNSALSTVSILRMLRRFGGDFGSTTLKEHRGKRCGCYQNG